MSLRKTLTFTTQISGAEPSWLPRANERRFGNCATSDCGTRCEFITKKANFSAGGIIKCARLKKTAACASMPFWQAKVWRKNVSRPGSIAKCVEEKILPIMRRCGRSLHARKRSTLSAQRPMVNADSELDVGRSTLMPNKSHLRVSNPPPKPLLIWDGACDFCRLWIERWREITADKIDYATYQEVAGRFHEIPVDQFQRAMVFIEPDGKAFFAAQAVYRSLAY